MENLGVDLDATAGEIGFHLRFAPRKSPTYKGGIERFFRTFNRRLLHEQRGTTFSNVLQRDDYDPAKNAVITLEELLYLLHKWLLDVYACSVHKGVRNVPRRLWDELTIRYPIQPVSSIADLDMMFGRLEDRVLQRTGITFEYIRYSSEPLLALLADARFRKASPARRLRFRYDPADLGIIRVFDPCENKYFTVPVAKENEKYARGLSVWQHRLITAHVNRRNAKAVDHDALARAKVDIAAFFEAAMSNRKTGARKAAARHNGVGRLAPAGSDHATSPPGSVNAEQRDQTQIRKGKAHRLPPTKQASATPPSMIIAANDGWQVNNEEEDIYAELGIKR